jgi:hypothetical protein
MRSRILEVAENDLEQCDDDALQDAQIQNLHGIVEHVVGGSMLAEMLKVRK